MLGFPLESAVNTGQHSKRVGPEQNSKRRILFVYFLVVKDPLFLFFD